MPYAINGQVSTEPIAGGIEISEQQYRQAIEGMLHGEVVSIDGGFSVAPAPEPETPEVPEPAPLTLEQKADQVRAQRNALLQQSDFSQLPDAPVNTAAWATYRQALRDITEQTGFPEVVEWPIKPE